ncbi:MAG TPA: hypothetical protein VFK06_06405 [Candidatus Angelobacter sp.]|nr:hypothetical protein [Candidatus Angelobacter sp.]
MNDGREISPKRKADGAVAEARYAYYRRCQRFRRDGVQCKAPALKGEELCYQHAAQAAASSRREAAVKSLGIPSRIASPRGLQTAISRIAQALADGRLDVKAGAMMLEKIRAAAAGLQTGALTTDLHR